MIFVMASTSMMLFLGLGVYSYVKGRSYRMSRRRSMVWTRSQIYGLSMQSIKAARLEEMREIPL